MKLTWCFWAAAVILLQFSSAPAAPLNILYYGNSLTLGHHSARSVPYLIDKLATAGGFEKPNNVDASIAATSLLTHSTTNTNIISTGLAAGKTWDFVVLQDRSHIPTLSAPGADLPGHRAGALSLYQSVAAHSPDVTPVLFETWARAAFHSYYPTYFSNPAAMQAEVRSGYNLSRGDIDAFAGSSVSKLARIGDAWEKAGFPNNFYASDGQHGANRGTLLASLVLYGTIYGDNTTSDLPIGGVLSDLGLSAQDGTYLTSLADAVIPPKPLKDKTVLVSFGNGMIHNTADLAGNVWNSIEPIRFGGGGDITGMTDLSGVVLNDLPELVDSTGVGTGISLTITDPLVNTPGHRPEDVLPSFTDSDTGFHYENAVTGGYHFGRLTSDNNFGIYTLGNLEQGTEYDLTILSARANGQNITTQFTIHHGGTAMIESIDGGQNGVGGVYELLHFNDLTADANGEIQIEIDGEDINTFINFLRLDYDASPGLPGDYNGDGSVDAADYTIWRDTLGSTTDLRANGDNSGASQNVIDAADYATWKNHFGEMAGGGSFATNHTPAVPEPQALAILVAAFAAAFCCRAIRA